MHLSLQILLGDDSYTEAIDMWAVGCVLGELLQGSPLFPGQTEQETVSRIVALLGHPTEVRARKTVWEMVREG